MSNISRPMSPGPTPNPPYCQSDSSIPRIYIPGLTSPYLPSARESPSRSPISECHYRSPNLKSTSIGCTPVYAAEAQARRRRHSLSGRALRPAAMSPLRSTSDSHSNARCQRRSADFSFVGCDGAAGTMVGVRSSTEPLNATLDYFSRPS